MPATLYIHAERYQVSRLGALGGITLAYSPCQCSTPLYQCLRSFPRYLKHEIKSLGKGLTLDEARDAIAERIDDFINVNFVLHPKAISETANRKIQDSDVILTFSHSKVRPITMSSILPMSPQLVEKILTDAALLGKRPRVIVAEARRPGLPAQGKAATLAAVLTKVMGGVLVGGYVRNSLDGLTDQLSVLQCSLCRRVCT